MDFFDFACHVIDRFLHTEHAIRMGRQANAQPNGGMMMAGGGAGGSFNGANMGGPGMAGPAMGMGGGMNMANVRFSF